MKPEWLQGVLEDALKLKEKELEDAKHKAEVDISTQKVTERPSFHPLRLLLSSLLSRNLS